MKNTPVRYLDRIIDRSNFRTFIYGAKGEKKLVESWEEFEAHMQTGIWFATLQETIHIFSDAEEIKEEVKVQSSCSPKSKSKAKPKIDEMVFEVTEDDGA